MPALLSATEKQARKSRSYASSELGPMTNRVTDWGVVWSYKIGSKEKVGILQFKSNTANQTATKFKIKKPIQYLLKCI